jgi:predicted AAA+ superfamily ATPase
VNLPKDIQTRAAYLNKTMPFIGKQLIKVFTGQRRVGKSYLLFQIMAYVIQQDNEAAIIYINKEDLQFSFILTAADLVNYINEQKSTNKLTYVFIDEIQDIENFGQALRSLLLDGGLDLYCTGSNANMLSGDIAGNLSGRYIEIEVFSLSYIEFLQFHNLNNNQEALDYYLKYGGLPYLKHLPLDDEIVFEYLKNIYNTIIYRDIINRFNVRSTTFLEQLVLFLANNTGSLFSAKKISDFLKTQRINMAPNQVQTYIGHLTSAFIIHQVPRYDIVGKRLFEIGDKYYFENLGIRHGIWGYRLEDMGKIIENAVYNQLLYKGFKVTVGVLHQAEIDFIADKNGEKHYYQVALTVNLPQTFEREFGNLKAIADNYPKTVITMQPFSGNTVDGIQVVDLRTFLSV